MVEKLKVLSKWPAGFSVNSHFAVFVLLPLILILPFSPVRAEKENIRLKGLQPFIEGIISAQLDQYHVPGASVSVVAGEEILLNKGYGSADIVNSILADPDNSLFRPGSVSKLFIWTAIAQLIGRGKLDPDGDINNYLENVAIPEKYGSPIRIKHLFTHTPGFEDRGINLYAPSARKMVPLEEALKKYRPARVRPAGELPAYSNYGTAIAGQIIADVSGTSYLEYLEKHIFEPLEMKNSTFRQPPGETVPGEMAKGYRWKNGHFVEGDFEFVQLGPGGAMSSTAGDMANFMIAHLNGGQFKGNEILSAEMTRTMHERQFAPLPDSGGWTVGFIEIFLNGERILLHGGDTDLFHSGLFLLPEREIGIFVSYNAPGGARARMNLLVTFLDRYFPDSREKEKSGGALADSSYSRPIRDFTGSYRPARSNYTTFEKVSNLMTPIKIEKLGGNKIMARGLGGGPTEWLRVGETTFENTNFRVDESLFFSEAKEDKIKYVFMENNPTNTLIKLPWWGSQIVQMAIPAGTAGFFLLSFIGWLLSFVYRKVHGVRLSERKPIFRSTRALAGLVMLCFLVFLAGFVLTAGSGQIIYGITTLGLVSLGFGMAGAVLTVFLLGSVVLSWQRVTGACGHKIHWTLIGFVSLIFIWWMNYWNLLGVKI